MNYKTVKPEITKLKSFLIGRLVKIPLEGFVNDV